MTLPISDNDSRHTIFTVLIRCSRKLTDGVIHNCFYTSDCWLKLNNLLLNLEKSVNSVKNKDDKYYLTKVYTMLSSKASSNSAT